MQKESYKSSSRKVALVVLLAVLLVSLSLSGCSQFDVFLRGGEENMTQEEIIEMNTDSIQKHLEGSGFEPTSWPLRSTAHVAAMNLSYVTEKTISSISSDEPDKGLLLTITVSSGEVYLISVGESGSTDTIYDEEGSVLYRGIL